MSLKDRFSIYTNSLWFRPALRETDHTNVVGHQSDVMNVAEGAYRVQIPRDTNVVLAQAVGQNITYTLSGTVPTATSGFVLIAGNDPIAIPIDPSRTILQFAAAVNGARLELQFGIM